jgi:hypothetical protein
MAFPGRDRRNSAVCRMIIETLGGWSKCAFIGGSIITIDDDRSSLDRWLAWRFVTGRVRVGGRWEQQQRRTFIRMRHLFLLFVLVIVVLMRIHFGVLLLLERYRLVV